MSMRSGLASAGDKRLHRSMAPPEVVVVDDEESAANEMAHCLAKAGLACTALSNPWQALKLLADPCRPRVAMVDIRMPELNGLELVERLNALGQPDRPEIILVSGNAGFDDAVVALQLGVRRLLCKPLDLTQLVQEVKMACVERDLRAGRSVAAELERGRQPLGVDDLIAFSRGRERFFPREMLSDHCWRMYLELYKSSLQGRKISITSLALVSGLPMATAIRKIHTMRNLALVSYEMDPQDRRRTFVDLSETGVRQIEKFLEQLDFEASARAKPRTAGAPTIRSN